MFGCRFLFTRQVRVFVSAVNLNSLEFPQHSGYGGCTRLNAPAVGIASTATGSGYYLVASDGGVFTFGAAEFHGSGVRVKGMTAPQALIVTTSGDVIGSSTQGERFGSTAASGYA